MALASNYVRLTGLPLIISSIKKWPVTTDNAKPSTSFRKNWPK